MLLKVVLRNKSYLKDLKIWYRLSSSSTQNDAALNVRLPASLRKAYLNANSSKVIETLVKVDPTKNFFFRNLEDIRVELEVTVRNGGDEGTNTQGKYGRAVHYAP